MNTTRNWILLTVFTILAFFAVKWMAEYQERKNTITEPTVDIDIAEIKARGSLRVIIEYNSISYFIYKGQRLGFEFELMQQFAKSLGVKLEIVLAKSADDQFNMLNEGKGDIIANGLFQNNKIKQQVALTQPYRKVEQVIVQRKGGFSVNPIDSIQKKDTLLQSVSELADKIVYVPDNSIYYNRLKELSDSSGINMDVRILPDERGTDGDTKSHFPSVTATSGCTASPSIARRAASFWAADMPNWCRWTRAACRTAGISMRWAFSTCSSTSTRIARCLARSRRRWSRGAGC